MSSRMKWVIGVLVLAVALMPAFSLAEEHGGQEHGGKEHGGAAPAAAPEEGDSGAAVAPPAAADTTAVPTPPAAPPALKPIVITFSGDLATVDAAAAPALITVQDRYGVKKEISVPAEAKIAQGTAAKTLGDLKVGDKLTVEYTYDVATGKRTAQSITVGEGAPSE